MEEIKAGDIVKTKSGGPFMTVGSVSDGNANCVWMDTKGKKNSDSFPIAVLEKIDFNEDPQMPFLVG